MERRKAGWSLERETKLMEEGNTGAKKFAELLLKFSERNVWFRRQFDLAPGDIVEDNWNSKGSLDSPEEKRFQVQVCIVSLLISQKKILIKTEVSSWPFLRDVREEKKEKFSLLILLTLCGQA